MIYEIKIDRSSIKPNPFFGTSSFHVPGASTTTFELHFTTRGMVQDLLESVTPLMTPCGLSPEYIKDGTVIAGVTRDVTTIEQLIDLVEMLEPVLRTVGVLIDRSRLQISTSRQVTTQYVTAPSRIKYLFNYLPTEVECKYCHKKFPHTALEEGEDELWYGEDDPYHYIISETICPHCSEWDCCEIEHEEMTDQELKEELK